MLKLIDLVEQGWTYKTLDTLVEFVALDVSLRSTKDVNVKTIKLILDTLRDEDIRQAINHRKEKGAETVTSYFGVNDIEAEVASEESMHFDLAEKLWIQLVRERKAKKRLNNLRTEAFQRRGNKLDHSADFLFDLSLKPPGT